MARDRFVTALFCSPISIHKIKIAKITTRTIRTQNFTMTQEITLEMYMSMKDSYDDASETSEESRASNDSDKVTPLAYSQSVLIIGATGREGTEVVRQLASAEHHPTIYGMSRDILGVSQDSMKVHLKNTEMLIEGDVAKPQDLHRALLLSGADTIVFAIDDNIAEDLRTEAARSIVKVLRYDQFRQVRLIVVSFSHLVDEPHGNHNRRLFNKAVEAKREHIKHDHTEQEQILLSEDSIQARTTVVRPTALTSSIRGEQRFSIVKQTTSRMSGAIARMQKKYLVKGKTSRQNSKYHETSTLASYLVDEVVHSPNKGMVVSVPNGLAQ